MSQGNGVGEDQQQNTTLLNNLANRQQPPWVLTWNDRSMRDSNGDAYWVSQLVVTLPDGTSVSYTGEGRRRGHARDQAAYQYLTTHGFRAREPL